MKVSEIVAHEQRNHMESKVEVIDVARLGGKVLVVLMRITTSTKGWGDKIDRDYSIEYRLTVTRGKKFRSSMIVGQSWR